MRTRRVFAVSSGLALLPLLLTMAVSPASAAAAPATLTIGVDNASPAGHNWEFLDYFPRSGVNVHNGDILHFKFNTGSVDGFHTATLGALGQSADQIGAAIPGLSPDTSTGDASNALEFSGFFSTNPPAGSGAPGACGDATTPCNYDGSSPINSGPFPVIGTDFYYKVNLANSPNAPTTVNYICTVHGPAMSGSFVIVPDAAAASTQAALDAAATSQYNSDLSAGSTAEAAANHSAVATNSDGSKTVTMQAGTESPDGRVQILEMLPTNVSITAGDKVRWVAPSRNDPHTVSFPDGVDTHDPFPGICETATGDAPATAGPPTFGCAGPPGSPNGFHVDYDPTPVGGTSITSPTATTTTSSGVLDAGTWFSTVPDQYTFTFPKAGTFNYQCLIHDHMVGTIAVSAAAAPGLPKSGRATVPTPLPPVVVLAGLLVALVGGSAARWLLRRRLSS